MLSSGPGIVLTLAALVLSIIAHEVAHGYAADSLGDRTPRMAGRLTLNPFAHIDLLGSVLIPALLVLSNSSMLFGWAKPVPYNPYNLKNQRWGDAMVAVAGSATNIALALIFAGVARFASAEGMTAAASFAAVIVFVNLFLGLFNLIPFPPMDGFTVLRGILPNRFSYGLIAFENRIRSLGVVALIGVLLVFSFVLAGPFFGFVSYLWRILIGAM